MRFGSSPEEQKLAHTVVSAMREGDLDRRNKVPAYIDKDGVPVYRVLLHGLRWQSDGPGSGCYRAADGVLGETRVGRTTFVSMRQWAIGKDAKGWGVVLHDDQDGSPHVIADGVRTLREAKKVAEERARRTPWIEGAPC